MIAIPSASPANQATQTERSDASCARHMLTPATVASARGATMQPAARKITRFLNPDRSTGYGHSRRSRTRGDGDLDEIGERERERQPSEAAGLPLRPPSLLRL